MGRAAETGRRIPRREVGRIRLIRDLLMCHGRRRRIRTRAVAFMAARRIGVLSELLLNDIVLNHVVQGHGGASASAADVETATVEIVVGAVVGVHGWG